MERAPSLPGGHANFGGDSSAVRDQLKGVVQIQATRLAAFAAILEDESVLTWGNESSSAVLEDGSVVTWGDGDQDNFGGDSSAVRDQLKGVQQIQATEQAFAAILEDGSVVTWGEADCGGDSSAIRDQLRGVQQIQATGGAPPPASCTSTCSAPPGPCADKSTGCEGRKTYRAFSGLLHQDVLGALGLCADNSTGCELEKHVRRLVGSLP